MSPERGQYHLGFDEVISNAKVVILRDGNHAPVLIVEGNKNIVVGQIHLKRINKTSEANIFY